MELTDCLPHSPLTRRGRHALRMSSDTRQTGQIGKKMKNFQAKSWIVREYEAIQNAKFQATVYHGGSLRGLGSYGSTKKFKTEKAATRAGNRLAAKCHQICGGSPFVEIYEIGGAL